MRLLVTVAILSMVSNSCGTAKQRQSDPLKDRNAKRKTDQEPDRDLALRFFDALTGKPLADAHVSSHDQSEMTNHEGRVLLKWPANLNGQEDLRTVRVSRQGYITSAIELHFTAGTLFSTRFSISPALTPERLRVVLDWGASPADLDAHLIKQKRFHISYRDMKSWRDVARLDRDDTDGHGPETITIDRVDARGDYAFMVHDYTHHHNAHSANFHEARATVLLYMDGRLKAQFRPPRGRGNLWNVFSLRGGQLTTENQVSRLR